MIGIATVARPDDDGIRNESGRNSPYMMLMKATPPSPASACSAALRTVSVIWPLVMITVTPRAIPMISATPEQVAGAVDERPVNSPSDIRATNPMRIENSEERGGHLGEPPVAGRDA